MCAVKNNVSLKVWKQSIATRSCNARERWAMHRSETTRDACSVRATCTVTRETGEVDISTRIQKNTFEVESQNRRTDSIIEEARSGLRKIVLLRVYRRINVATMWRRTTYTRNFLWLVTFSSRHHSRVKRAHRKKRNLWSLVCGCLAILLCFYEWVCKKR